MPEGKRPDYVVSTVIEKGTKRNRPERDRWRAVGVAFSNRDGSISVMLDALPQNGRLVLQVPKEPERPEDDEDD